MEIAAPTGRMEARSFVERAAGRLRRELHPYVAWGVVNVYATPLSGPVEAPASAFEAREASGPALAEAARAFGRPVEQFAARSAKGDRCVCTYAGSSPIHMRWFATSPTFVPELGAWACPGHGEAYVFDSHTDPAWRRRGAMAVERARMIDLLLETGVRRTWNYVLADNGASLATLLPQARLEVALPFIRLGGLAPWIRGALRHPVYRGPPPRAA